MVEEYIDKIVENGSNEDMEELADILVDVMYKLKEKEKTCYDKYMLKLYELAEGEHLTEEMAKEWVSSMQPSAKWTIDETTEAANSLGYKVDPVEFYVVANMMWSDNYDLVKDEPTLALKLAYNWLNDSDIGEHKLYKYWKYVYKGEDK